MVAQFDADVVGSLKKDLEIIKHARTLLDHTSVPVQDLAEALIFVTFVFGLDGRPIFSWLWLTKVSIVTAGLIATDFFAPAMSQPIRLSLAVIFYAGPSAALATV
jgi:hypothetical protein